MSAEERAMSKAAEYRLYANECIESARTATSDPVRKQFLDLAKMWMTAATQIENGIEVPPLAPASDPSKNPTH